jgi:hypothetical protein
MGAGGARWRRGLVIGCGGAALLVAVLCAVAAVNWRSVTALYRSTSTSYSELQAVRGAVQSEYGTPQVIVKSMRRLGAPGLILVVQIVNSPQLSQLSEPDLRAKARDIAVLARSAYSSREPVDTYEVVISSQMGIGVTVSRARHFRFRAAELRSEGQEPHSNGN